MEPTIQSELFTLWQPDSRQSTLFKPPLGWFLYNSPMRTSSYFLPTQREAPAEAEATSHRLMLRAGLVRRLASGLYTWLPLGRRVLRRVETVVREEMDRAGALEVLMPMVQPSELWRRSGRREDYGSELLTFLDRHGQECCLAPTHEEVITTLVGQELSSYRQLPLNLYQISTKFRDEIRPRFGVMRAREFLMKDAYSFHRDQDCLERCYRTMHDAYCRIFTRLGLEFRVVEADSGQIGGAVSHEFQVLAAAGENSIAINPTSDYAITAGLAPCPAVGEPPPPSMQLRVVDTANCHSIAAVCEQLGSTPERTLKVLVVAARSNEPVALLLRGDHTLSTAKAARAVELETPLRFIPEDELRSRHGLQPGVIGPIGLELPLIADHAAAELADFICGANRKGHHYTGANWGRDAPPPRCADLRCASAGDTAPDGGILQIKRGIEVGHIFQLGQKYSRTMNAQLNAEDGSLFHPHMGCYGIGVSRIIAAAIEQHHDETGIVWPTLMAPFQVGLVPLGQHRSAAVGETTERLYTELEGIGISVLLDDRPERPGVKFADMELIGLPYLLVIGERGLQRGIIEFRQRGGEERELPCEEVVSQLSATLSDTGVAV